MEHSSRWFTSAFLLTFMFFVSFPFRLIFFSVYSVLHFLAVFSIFGVSFSECSCLFLFHLGCVLQNLVIKAGFAAYGVMFMCDNQLMDLCSMFQSWLKISVICDMLLFVRVRVCSGLWPIEAGRRRSLAEQWRKTSQRPIDHQRDSREDRCPTEERNCSNRRVHAEVMRLCNTHQAPREKFHS